MEEKKLPIKYVYTLFDADRLRGRMMGLMAKISQRTARPITLTDDILRRGDMLEQGFRRIAQVVTKEEQRVLTALSDEVERMIKYGHGKKDDLDVYRSMEMFRGWIDDANETFEKGGTMYDLLLFTKPSYGQPVHRTKKRHFMPYQEGTKWGVKDDEGNDVLMPEYDEVELGGSGMIRLRKGDKYGFYNAFDNNLFPLKYDDAYGFRSYWSETVVRKGNCWGVVDTTGEEIVPLEYSYVSIDKYNRYRVCKDGLYGVIDKDGKVFLPFKYVELGAYKPDTYICAANQSGKYGFIDTENNVLIDFQFAKVWNFCHEYARVFDGKCYGLINKKGEFILPMRYQEMRLVSGDVVILVGMDEISKVGHKYGLFDLKTGYALPCIYNEIWSVMRDKEELVKCMCSTEMYSVKLGVDSAADKFLRAHKDLTQPILDLLNEMRAHHVNPDIMGLVVSNPKKVIFSKEKCSTCGGQRVSVWYRSSSRSWRHLAGRVGYLPVCCQCGMTGNLNTIILN